jgi:hypothetical protein
VIKRKHDKCEGGEPDAGDLTEVLPAHERQVCGQTDQPVGSDAAEENLVPGGLDGFCGPEGYDSGDIDRLGKRSPVPDDDGHYEERASEITPECDEPVQQHFPGREPAVASGDRCELNMKLQSATWDFAACIAPMETYHETPCTQVRPR